MIIDKGEKLGNRRAEPIKNKKSMLLFSSIHDYYGHGTLVVSGEVIWY